jgi:cell division protein FtsI/penicillin-binding protein 2
MTPRQPIPGSGPNRVSTNRRLFIWYAAVIFIIGIIILRLFYLQIIRHDYYRKAALNDQLKQYSITADRGTIEAHQGTATVPLVLNQKLYTLYADPSLVKDAGKSARQLVEITGAKAADYENLMKNRNTRYVVLAQRLSQQQSGRILALKLPGVGTRAQNYRVYPQGGLAAQLLGFVDNGGSGRYGLEQQFNQKLAGTPGMLKAITDVNGVPLAASRDNVQINPKPGDDLVLTIDLALQRQVEQILQQQLKKVNSPSGSVVVIDPNTGAIKAVANYPTYDPSKFYQVKDLSAFNDAAVSSPLEVGSIMKTMTASAGLDQGVITPDTAYHDPGYVTVDGSTIKNVLPIPEDPLIIKDVLKYSLNTGAVHILKQLGGGQLDRQGRDVLYNYLSNHFLFGRATGVDLPNEAAGVIPGPDHGSALDLQYANMSFGQGQTETMLQMASALSAVINGGTYYRPHVVEQKISANGKVDQTGAPVVKKNIVKASTGKQLQGLMEYVFNQNYDKYASHLHPGYNIGGKTGTGQIPYQGGYKTGIYNGTFLGFVGGDKPQYVIAVLTNEPRLPDFESAGSQGAAPIFGKIVDTLIDDFNVSATSASNQ